MNNVEKIKMPKVFDDWYKEKEGRDKDSIISDFVCVIEMLMSLDETDERLEKYVTKHISNSTERYINCVEAIIHGYEVEE